MSRKSGVRLGYACINITLREKGIYLSRTITLKSIREKGVEAIRKVVRQNVNDLYSIIEWNEAHGIRFMRIPIMFPHHDVGYSMTFAKSALAKAGALARKLGHRITMHPPQFVQLGTKSSKRTAPADSDRLDAKHRTPNVLANSIDDLRTHAKVLAMMGLTPERDGAGLIIHGGGYYGNREDTLKRWRKNFRKMPAAIRKYVVLENDEHYSIRELLPVCEDLNIPLCIDFFHHTLRGEGPIDDKLLKRVLQTWKRRGIKPKCHLSNQDPNLRRGAHSKCVADIPILGICEKYGIDIMLEVKDKELCVLKMYNKYPILKRELESYASK